MKNPQDKKEKLEKDIAEIQKLFNLYPRGMAISLLCTLEINNILLENTNDPRLAEYLDEMAEIVSSEDLHCMNDMQLHISKLEQEKE